jgi:general secretion pathway protein I
MARLSTTPARGFTLLEVLVAVSILGLGLTAILSAQAGSFASAAHARNVSVAVSLLRCKMTEVEEHLYKEGFQETDETGSGPCCDGDETPNMTCTWRADRPQFPDAQFGDLNLSSALDFSGGGSGSPGGGGLGALGMLSQMGGGAASPLGGASSMTDVAKTLADANATMTQSMAGAAPVPMTSASSVTPPGSPTMDPNGGAGSGMGGLASMAMSLVYPNLKLLFEASTRRITATVTFREGGKQHAIEVTEWFCVPQKGLAFDDQSAQDTGPAAATPRPGSATTKTGTGLPGPSGLTGTGH